MHSFAIAPGLLVDAEVAYRREQAAGDLTVARRVRGWWGSRRRRAASTADLTLAA